MNYQSTNKIKCDFILFFIFNGLSATGNGNTSMCCGNSELIRITLIYLPKQPDIVIYAQFLRPFTGINACRVYLS